ncbi:hypothetical protein, partial [Helicobacter pylori]|uniref:hypothetical protein n=1 Tax=Helicobacter pylori TaxID=210 RepID=UPI002ED04AC5
HHLSGFTDLIAYACVKAVVFSVEQKRERERESKRVFFMFSPCLNWIVVLGISYIRMHLHWNVFGVL